MHLIDDLRAALIDHHAVLVKGMKVGVPPSVARPTQSHTHAHAIAIARPVTPRAFVAELYSVRMCHHGLLVSQVHSVKRQDAMAPMHGFLEMRFKSMEELLTRHGVLTARF